MAELAAARSRSFWDVVLHEPAALAAAVPHQVLISMASVAILTQYATDRGFLPLPLAIALAVGVEWAWLRGMASARETSSAWVGRLNWSAFAILVLWGLLWGFKLYGVLPLQPGRLLGGLLAASHILPIAWLGLCAAMVHAAAERERASVERARQTTEQQKHADADQRRAELEQQYRTQRMAIELADLEARTKAQRRRDLSVHPVRGQSDHAPPTATAQDIQAVRAKAADILRTAPDVSTAELARRCGVSRQYLYRHGIVQKREG